MACAFFGSCGNQCSPGHIHCCRLCPAAHTRGCVRRQLQREEEREAHQLRSRQHRRAWLHVAPGPRPCAMPVCSRLVVAPHRHCSRLCPVSHTRRCAGRSQALEQGLGAGAALQAGASSSSLENPPRAVATAAFSTVALTPDGTQGLPLQNVPLTGTAAVASQQQQQQQQQQAGFLHELD